MKKKTYRSHTAEFKIHLLKKHLIDKIPVSSLCEEYDVKASVFYSWQKELFDRGDRIFGVSKAKQIDAKYQARIKQLEAKLSQKNEVLSELMEEHLVLKKNLGML